MRKPFSKELEQHIEMFPDKDSTLQTRCCSVCGQSDRMVMVSPGTMGVVEFAFCDICLMMRAECGHTIPTNPDPCLPVSLYENDRYHSLSPEIPFEIRFKDGMRVRTRSEAVLELKKRESECGAQVSAFVVLVARRDYEDIIYQKTE